MHGMTRGASSGAPLFTSLVSSFLKILETLFLQGNDLVGWGRFRTGSPGFLQLHVFRAAIGVLLGSAAFLPPLF